MFCKLFAVTAFVAALATAAPADTCSRSTTVKSGENCNVICQRTKTPIFQLHHFNPQITTDCTNLHAGDVLCLAQKGRDCTGDNAYEVAAGDSCASITNKFHITLDVFLANNGMEEEDCPKIQVGQVVCVSKTHINY